MEKTMNMIGKPALTPAYTQHRAAMMSVALCSLGFAGLTPSGVLAQEISDEWQFAATVYGWFPDIGGNTQFPAGGGPSIDVDVSTILDNLKMTAQGTFEIQKGHWGAFTDLVYLDVGDSRTQTRGLAIGGQPLPGTVTASIGFDLKSVIWTLAGSYRSFASPAATLDWLAGARLVSIDQDLDWAFTGDFGPITPPPLTGSRSTSADQWDAIVGIKGRFGFGAEHKWVMPYYFDVGTGDSDLTWQAMLGFGYVFNWGELGVAWRYLDYDLESGGPIEDLNFNGPGAGVTFRW
jgi:hypothetical protein